MRERHITARYRGRCRCGATVRPGDAIDYAAGRIVGCGACTMNETGPAPARTRDLTIEYCWANPRAGTPEGGYTVYEHGIYPGGSVLAGSPMRTWKAHFDTVEEAKAAYPSARAIEGSTYRSIDEMMPATAPAWFDPSAAGEAWGEDDY